MDISCQSTAVNSLPGWVPKPVRRYLEHTEKGLSLRDVARIDGCHASTVLRQVRRFENRRDDPLVDEALDQLSRVFARSDLPKLNEGKDFMNAQIRPAIVSDDTTLAREARRILRRLCETGAVLVLAPDMDNAAVFRNHADTTPTRTAVVARDIAQAFALKNWISCAQTGRVARYTITSTGRAALKGFLDEDMDRKRERIELDENTSPFSAQHIEWAAGQAGDSDANAIRMRNNMAESPLSMLARRKDKDGRAFLDADLVQAGERFREDFELAQMGPRVARHWDKYMTSGDRGVFEGSGDLNEGSQAALDRIVKALDDLGPGLSDIIMRCCCFLEGLEAAEKRMGWSARSGKVVLRIALQRLRRHYMETQGRVSVMIG